MSAIQTSLSLKQSGSLLDKAKSKLHDVVENVKEAGNEINESVIQPLKESYDNIKESADILKEGADTLTNMATQLSSDPSLVSMAKATQKFDGDWEKFAADFDKKYKEIQDAGKDNVLETWVRQTLGDKVFEAGSIIKNETSQILGGANTIQTNLNTIINGEGDLLTKAKQIKDSTVKIVEAVKQVDSSLNNVFSRATTQLGIDASALINLQSRLHSLANNIGANIPEGIKTSVSRLGEGIDVLDSGRAMVNAIIGDCQGKVTVTSLAKLTTDLNKNWDSFAPKVNVLFSKLSTDDKTNILETFAKSHFGDNVFYAGSAIKKELPSVLEGISDFQSAIEVFNGDYSNPQAAVSTIRSGVEKIVKATEKIATSLNDAIKIYKGHGNTENAKGVPLLDTISKIGDKKVITTLTNSLALGSDGLSAYSNVSTLKKDLESGNLTQAWADLKNTFESAKKVKTDVDNLIHGKRATDAGDATKATVNSKDAGTKETKKEKEDDNDSKDSDSYVCSGATMKCTFGDSSAKLSVYPDRTVFLTGQPMANISDHVSMYNIHPFGKCHTTSYPPTGSATAANYGNLTPMPCVPGTQSNWMNGKNDYIIKGDPALLKSSYCKCCYGGIITITYDGQTDTGKTDLSRVPKE